LTNDNPFPYSQFLERRAFHPGKVQRKMPEEMERKIECINFDLDSVLYIPSDFLETTLLISIRAMIEVGLKARPWDALRKLVEIRSADPNAGDHFDRLCLHFNKKFDPLIVAAGIEKYWDCKVGVMTSAPETKPVLSALHDKYPLALITNGPPLKQAGKIVRLGLSHFFSRTVSNQKLQMHLTYATAERTRVKPYPYLWRMSRKDLGYRFSRAVMVGDRYWEDMFGAKRLGMITIKVIQGPHSHESMEEALEKGLQSRGMKTYFLRRHRLEEIRTLMRPDHVIPSLGRLERVIREVEETL
jgi:putative hydrolase of the HAD superfamily